MFAVFHYEDRENRTGITTELAAVATFLLALLAASRAVPLRTPARGRCRDRDADIPRSARPAAHAAARNHHAIRNSTPRWRSSPSLLVIYPLLPAGAFGPYSFFAPRQVWMFVILISSISYVGYFLEKFLGEERGLIYTSVLGGLASTTAATLHFSADGQGASRGDFRIVARVRHRQYRAVSAHRADRSAGEPRSARRAQLWPLAAMMISGVMLAEVLRRWPHKQRDAGPHEAGQSFPHCCPRCNSARCSPAIVFVTQMGDGASSARARFTGPACWAAWWTSRR